MSKVTSTKFLTNDRPRNLLQRRVISAGGATDKEDGQLMGIASKPGFTTRDTACPFTGIKSPLTTSQRSTRTKSAKSHHVAESLQSQAVQIGLSELPLRCLLVQVDALRCVLMARAKCVQFRLQCFVEERPRSVQSRCASCSPLQSSIQQSTIGGVLVFFCKFKSINTSVSMQSLLNHEQPPRNARAVVKNVLSNRQAKRQSHSKLQPEISDCGEPNDRKPVDGPKRRKIGERITSMQPGILRVAGKL